MSKKKEPQRMKHEKHEKNNKGLVPRLRFPEFRDAGEWEVKALTKFSDCGLSNGVFNDPKKVGRGYKLINVLDMYIDTVIDEGKLNLVELSKNEFLKNKVETGDIFFTRSSLVKSGIAYSNIYMGNSCDITFDGHLIRFRPNKNILSPMFANYLLRTYRVRTQLVARGKSATMTTIGQADVGGVKLTAPSLPEQQKIADCLSSLDELITAGTQKIDTLKAHKKGLMQKLFPAEGETVPGLRFPEFRAAEEWKVKTLGECLDYIQPTKYLVKSTAYNNSYKTPVLTAGKTFVLGYTDESQDIFSNKLPVIIFDDFTTATKFVDFPFKAKSSAMKILLARKDTNIKFIYEAMQIIKYEVGVHKRHWISKFAMLNIATPSPLEQQKIADCLSSLDELITAEVQKIDTLKAHKKGLMQGLFPSTDEVDA